MLFQPGDAAGDFTVIAPCGAGAFGQIYLVRDASGRRLALKVLSPDRRGERELDGLLRFKQVEHPNLLHIDRLSALPDGRVCYTMDPADNAAGGENYVPDTLAQRLRERGSIPPGELRGIMLELADALAALHRAHLLHRDIKPENILFVRGRATLADAGAVGEFDGTTLIGTPEYLPPEVCLQKRRFTAADDCYALGKVLYSALTGEAPRQFPSTPRTLEGEAVALFDAAKRACTPPGVSAYQFRELLKHPEKVVPRRKWRRTAFAATAVILLCMALAAAALYTKRPPTTAPTQEPAKPVTPSQTEPAKPVTPPQTEPVKPMTPQQTEPTKPVTPSQTKPAEPVTPPQTEPAKSVTPPQTEPSPSPAPAPAKTAESTAAERKRLSVINSEAFVKKMKADEAALRAEQERIKSPTVQPVGIKHRNAVSSAESTAAERKRLSVINSEAFVKKMKADEAALRAEQERIKSPTVQPVGIKPRNAVNSAEPTAAELVNKYRLSAEEQKLVDKWLVECVSFDRRINRAMWNKAKIAELTKEKKAKLPYGIDDFCGLEMRMRKYIDILTRDDTPDRRRKLEAALQYRRDALKKLLEKLPASELAKWR